MMCGMFCLIGDKFDPALACDIGFVVGIAKAVTGIDPYLLLLQPFGQYKVTFETSLESESVLWPNIRR